jgi:spore cortex formation protein SpoVR/YcgB (stage V sporulation)
VVDDSSKDFLQVSSIHDERGYQAVREALSALHNLSNLEPNIQVDRVDTKGDRSLHLRHDMYEGRPLEEKSTQDMLQHTRRLWGFDVELDSYNGPERVKSYQCKAPEETPIAS